jgi:Fibronectin type III domain
LKLRKLAWVIALVGALLAGCHESSTGSSTTTAVSGTQAPSAPSSEGAATLSWEAPTTDTNGAPLSNLAGYRIYYGTDATNLTQTVQLMSVGVQTYVIDNLAPGTWYFAIKAVSATGAESVLSDIVSKTIS